MLHIDQVWGFGRFERNGVLIQSITYFVMENPPKRDWNFEGNHIVRKQCDFPLCAKNIEKSFGIV